MMPPTPPASHSLHQNPNTSYVSMNNNNNANSSDGAGDSSKNSNNNNNSKMSNMLSPSLSPHEVYRLRQLLNAPQVVLAAATASMDDTDATTDDANSEYSEFPETTHAWAVFADKTNRKATKMDRIVGTAIIAFQLFTYGLFVAEAMADYQSGMVPVLTTHDQCSAVNDAGNNNNDDNNNNNNNIDSALQCEADVTSHWDACVAFFMLSIFLTPEILQALRATRAAILEQQQQQQYGNHTLTVFFALLAALEVVAAFLAAAIAISYQLYIGEVTDAIEVGVGLLFVRELSARAYHGIRHKGVKQYKAFFGMMVFLLLVGFVVESTCETIFGGGGGGGSGR